MGGGVSWLLSVNYERQSHVDEPGDFRLIVVYWLTAARMASDTIQLLFRLLPLSPPAPAITYLGLSNVHHAARAVGCFFFLVFLVFLVFFGGGGSTAFTASLFPLEPVSDLRCTSAGRDLRQIGLFRDQVSCCQKNHQVGSCDGSITCYLKDPLALDVQRARASPDAN